jgi:molecular chaperone DnaK
MKRIGIDLGTTNTVAALDGRVLHLHEDGGCCLPSVVAFLPNDTIQVGAVARSRRAIDSSNTVYSSKRIIGRRFWEAATQDFIERYPFDVVEMGDDTPAFRTRAGRHTPTQIASLILRHIHEKMQVLGSDVEVAITVPTAFNEVQRGATLEAACLAGFDQVKLVEEPMATVHAYRGSSVARGKVAVYDLGGGTFDFSIVECGDGEPRLLTHIGDPFLGGDDVDAKIAEWVTHEALKQHNWDLANYSEVYCRLLAECERAKIRLSRSEETLVAISQVDPECPMAGEGLVLRRSLLDELVSGLVRRTFIGCDHAMRQADLRGDDLSAVFLAGGSTNLSMVREGVEAYFGSAGRCDVEVTEVVAQGASLASS